MEEHFSLSEFLSKALKKDYNNITRLFSEVESITIEQFFILQKIEKVKNGWFIMNLLLVRLPGNWVIAVWRICPLNLKK